MDTPLEYLSVWGELPAGEPEYAPVLYWLWLAHLLGAGSSRAGAVLDSYENARAVWEDRGSEAFGRAIGTAALRRWHKAPDTPADYAPLWDRCRALGVRVLTFADAEYPLALSRISDPPLVLYCTGQVQYLNARCLVGMVGTRKPTQYGVSAARDFGRELAGHGAVIVSGLADGLDSVSHQAAVQAGAPTIGVLGVPIDKTYPAANAGLRRRMEENGTVISEYPPGASCDYRASFLQRNRIIAALSRALIVLEAQERSGTMSTVGHAQRYGRTVYAVPGSIYSPLSAGTNRLLQEGKARVATGAQDILAQLGLDAATPATPAATAQASAQTQRPLPGPQARQVLACIGGEPIGLEALAEKTGLPIGTLLVALTSLELTGWILAQPGQRYILK